MTLQLASKGYDNLSEEINGAYPFKARNLESSMNPMKLNNHLNTTANNNHRTKFQWLEISKEAAFFQGKDNILGSLIIMVFEDPDSKKMGTVLFSILGDYCYDALTLDHRSRFFMACENLAPEYKDSNVRRALAITLLKTYASIDLISLKTALPNLESNEEWDETVAGEVASSMTLIIDETPESIGKGLLHSGFLRNHSLNTALIDVIYEDKPEVTEANNNMVLQLGDQLQQLFDPLTEYSPESADLKYVPPKCDTSTDDQLVKSICSELMDFQETVTTRLVNFLRDVVIPIRIKSLNDPYFAPIFKVNQAFPPTIDEITRINCIFLEALKDAEPFGSFEIVKACGSTIPYFYKANMRHESAIKSSARPLKEFLFDYKDNFPDYTETQIESIIKSSLNLTKIKLILQRLVDTKKWEPSELSEVEKFYKVACDTIDSFGNDNLQPYSRLLTPSGRIMTEICANWPSKLSYGWMNRKVISVLDTCDTLSGDQGVIILFSDFIVFASIEQELQNNSTERFHPRVSSILMNSLTNGKPINHLPFLTTKAYCSLLNLEATSFGENSIRIVIKGEKAQVFSLKLDDNFYFLDLLNKTKILSKTSAFHLFKAEFRGFKIYSAAHEKGSYFKESIRSSIGFFLNMDLSIDLLKGYGMFGGFSAKVANNDRIEIKSLLINGETSDNTIPFSELSKYLVEEVLLLEQKRYSNANPELFRTLLSANQSIISNVLDSVWKNHLPPPSKKNISDAKLIDPNMVPKSSLVDNDNSSVKISSKQKKYNSRPSKFVAKLSKMFSKGKKHKNNDLNLSTHKPVLSTTKNPNKDNLSSKIHLENIKIPGKIGQKLPLSSTRLIPSVSNRSLLPQLAVKHSRNSIESTPGPDLFDASAADTSSFDDCKTFESLMVPIFSDELELESNMKLIRNSSKALSLGRNNSVENRNMLYSSPGSKTDDVGLFLGKKGNSVITSPSNLQHGIFASENVQNELQQDIPKSNSIDDDFRSPLLKVTVSFPEDSYKEDAFYHNYNVMDTEVTSQLNGDDDRERHLDRLDKSNEQSIDLQKPYSPSIEKNNIFMNFEISGKLPTLKHINFGSEVHQDSHSLRTESFKSCLTNPDWDSGDIDESRKIYNDDSFRYLASYMNGEQYLEKEELEGSFKTLPRSFSSIKYLAAYIDNDRWTPELEIMSESG